MDGITLLTSIGKTLSQLSPKTSSMSAPPCPPMSALPSMPVNTAALSVIIVNAIATQRPLLISFRPL